MCAFLRDRLSSCHGTFSSSAPHPGPIHSFPSALPAPAGMQAAHQPPGWASLPADLLELCFGKCSALVHEEAEGGLLSTAGAARLLTSLSACRHWRALALEVRGGGSSGCSEWRSLPASGCSTHLAWHSANTGTSTVCRCPSACAWRHGSSAATDCCCGSGAASWCCQGCQRPSLHWQPQLQKLMRQMLRQCEAC